MHDSIYVVMAVGHWVNASPSQAKGWEFESQTRQTEVIKTGSDSSTAKLSALGVWVSRVLENNHYKRMPRVTVGVARSLTLTAQWP